MPPRDRTSHAWHPRSDAGAKVETVGENRCDIPLTVGDCEEARD